MICKSYPEHCDKIVIYIAEHGPQVSEQPAVRYPFLEHIQPEHTYLMDRLSKKYYFS